MPRRRVEDSAVSDALDHFQNRYYELHKAAADVIELFDHRWGDDRDMQKSAVGEAVEALREKIRSKS